MFWQFGATYFYGQGSIYTNGDSHSYVQSFLNLWYHGRYSFDLLEPMASFGRTPGYPFFVGLHFLVFGPNYFQPAVAVSQILLDTASIGLCFLIGRQLFPQLRGAALLAALLYACYPFAIVWVTILGTETLGIFVVLLWANQLLITRRNPRVLHFLGLGLIAALALLVRAYLGILLPISLLFIFLVPVEAAQLRFRRMLLVGAGFLALYSWWPVRNLVFHQQLILIKPATAGYPDMKDDMVGFLDWVHLWSNDNTYWLHELMEVQQADRFPAHVISTPADRQLLRTIIQQANTCGSSFYVRRHLRNDLQTTNCNAALKAGFDTLAARYRHRHPWRAALEVPLQNVGKSLFKHQLKREAELGFADRLTLALFGMRSLLLAFAAVGAWQQRHNRRMWPLLLFGIFQYVYICFFFRSLEMRYLLQADALSLIVTAAGICGLFQTVFSRSAPGADAPAASA
ncbi:glycosyltransferase family 39 protein [Hymenobacter sp. BT175]|uniref:glycosyltransferase family 39 protein n=1 Tax=Hymenobacter translucens TaxID=2886507 RepID=UPI001D0ED5FA|nr:glycosyltransferase family 39 protein [Hymenobacter translucens]MCC2547926.1 glycosyltransferase family 39 protein [Hymenobacter translucens]